MRFGVLFLTICLVAVTISFAGCRETAPREWILPPDSRFCADVAGTLHGVPFAAHVEIEAENAGKRVFTLSFLPSGSTIPAGLTLVGACGAGGVPLQPVTATLGELRVEVSAAALQHLLLPVVTLLLRNDYSTIQKTESGFLLTFPDGATLTLSPDRSPLRFSSPVCEFEVFCGLFCGGFFRGTFLKEGSAPPRTFPNNFYF